MQLNCSNSLAADNREISNNIFQKKNPFIIFLVIVIGQHSIRINMIRLFLLNLSHNILSVRTTQLTRLSRSKHIVVSNVLDNCQSSPSRSVTSQASQLSEWISNEQGRREESHNDRNDDYKFKSRIAKAIGATALAASGIITTNNTGGDASEPPNGDNPRLVEDLHQAVLQGDERRVKILVKQCTPNDINSRHKLGWQLLHLAAVNGRSTICELLLQGGARVNDVDHYSSPRLMSEKLNIDPLVIALLRDTEFNSDLARVNFRGCTSLHYAALSNSLETVQVLTKYGANPTIKNELGFKPANFANPNVGNYIMQYEEEYTQRERELEEEERRKYPLEQRLKEHIIGQEAAISMVAATIRRKENGWFDEDHPLVFLFLGSSGIGKTELAKQVAKYLHKNNKKAFIRLDMSEYQEQHSVARMIGSPPGYVGFQDGGQLTDALKNCKNAVVLLDEVEKAHPKVLTVLLQLFDEGRLTDGKGKTVECKDAIFIMTSNLASEVIAETAMELRNEQQMAREMELNNRLKGLSSASNNEKSVESGGIQEQISLSRKFKDTVVKPILKYHFKRDEFLGRINEVVYFLPFSEIELKQLVVKELEFWAARAKKKNNIQLVWDDEVVDTLVKGYDLYYGCRSLKYEVERRILNPISCLQDEMGRDKMKNAKKICISVTHKGNDEADLINIKII